MERKKSFLPNNLFAIKSFIFRFFFAEQTFPNCYFKIFKNVEFCEFSIILRESKNNWHFWNSTFFTKKLLKITPDHKFQPLRKNLQKYVKWKTIS
jgi:hypothetical protein